MEYSEMYNLIAKYNSRELPLFADGWNRLPEGQNAAMIVDLLKHGKMGTECENPVPFVPNRGHHASIETLRIQSGRDGVGCDPTLPPLRIFFFVVGIRTSDEGDPISLRRPNRRALHTVDVEGLSTRAVHPQEPNCVRILTSF